MSRREIRSPDLIIGVDPSLRHNAACALDLLTDELELFEFGFIEELGRCEGLAALGDRAREGGLHVLALIECPTWSGRGTKEVRSAALVWERALQREFPRRQVFRVDPRNWQRQLLGVTKGDTKGLSMLRAVSLLGRPAHSDHEADAACICEFASLFAKGQVALPRV